MPFAWLVHESDSLWSSSHAMHGRSCSCAHLSTASFFCPFRLPVSPLPLSLEQKVRAGCLWRKLSRLLLRSGVVPPSVCVVFIRPPVCERSRFSAPSPFICFFCRAVCAAFQRPVELPSFRQRPSTFPVWIQLADFRWFHDRLPTISDCARLYPLPVRLLPSRPHWLCGSIGR